MGARVSATLLQVADKVRVHCNDVRNGREVFAREIVYGKINSAMLGTIATRLNLGRTYLAGALTIGNSTNTYSLPSTAQYQIIRQVHTQGRGRDLDIISTEQMAAQLNNIIDPSRVTGYPLMCSMWEQPDQVVKIKFYPWPNVSEVVDLMQSVLPLAVTVDTDVIPLDDAGIEALAYDAAAELIAMANQEKLTALRLSPMVVARYELKRDQALRECRVRAASLHAVSQSRPNRRSGS